MLSKWQFHVLNALAVLALALVVANGVLFKQNRSEQSAFNQRQQFIQQTVPLETLYREIVKALADLAVKSNDRAVLDMLGSQGISVTVNTPAPAPAPAAADVAPRKVGK
jgi:hypothetical protein